MKITPLRNRNNSESNVMKSQKVVIRNCASRDINMLHEEYVSGCRLTLQTTIGGQTRAFYDADKCGNITNCHWSYA